MIRAGRIVGAAAICLSLGACAADPVWAPDEFVSRSTYVPPGPASVTLLTMVGGGGHSALLIDGAQRLLFDPAGTWYHPMVPERNDVLFGMSPQFMDFYIDYHARETVEVVMQEVQVSAEQAAFLSAEVQAYGAVPNAQCNLAISRVLSRTPGFEAIRPAWFPGRTLEQFASLPGVTSQTILDDDSDDNLELLQAQARAQLSREFAAEVFSDD